MVSIVAAPDDEIIDKVRLRTLPVREFKGIVFIFIGDESYAPAPPVDDDYEWRAAHPLDPDTALLGIQPHRKLELAPCRRGGWRLECEFRDGCKVLISREKFGNNPGRD